MALTSPRNAGAASSGSASGSASGSSSPTSSSEPAQPPSQAASPAALRLRRPRWTEPRMVIGILLVLASVVLGVRVLTAADSTVPVLTAARDVTPGQPVRAADFEVRNVGLDDSAQLYLAELPAAADPQSWVVSRELARGELVPREALAPASELASARTVRYLTLALPVSEAPPGLVAGSVVDVWRLPGPQAESAEASLALSEAVVTATDDSGDGLVGSVDERRVTLAVRADTMAETEELLVDLLAAARQDLLYLTAVPGGSGSD